MSLKICKISILQSLLLAMVSFVIQGSSSTLACDGACSCTITTSPLSFSGYKAMDSPDNTTISQITVACSTTVTGDSIAYELSFSPGSSGNALNRYMVFGASKLLYNIYKTPSFLQVLGDGNNSTYTIANSYTFTADMQRTDQYNLYGLIPGGQNIISGTYVDQISVTTNFQ